MRVGVECNGTDVIAETFHDGLASALNIDAKIISDVKITSSGESPTSHCLDPLDAWADAYSAYGATLTRRDNLSDQAGYGVSYVVSVPKDTGAFALSVELQKLEVRGSIPQSTFRQRLHDVYGIRVSFVSMVKGPRSFVDVDAESVSEIAMEASRNKAVDFRRKFWIDIVYLAVILSMPGADKA